MATPRKKFDTLASPYVKHVPQYPSQSEEYIPFNMGGPGSHRKESATQQRHYTSTPAKYNNQYNKGNRQNEGNGPGSEHNFNLNRQNFRGRGNNRYFGGRNSFFVDNAGVSEAGQQRQPQNRYSGFGYRRGGGNGANERQRFQNNRNDDSSYFHPSMLEDPWKELMERHNAIKNSRIDFEPQQGSTNVDAQDSSSDCTSDGEVEKKLCDDKD